MTKTKTRKPKQFVHEGSVEVLCHNVTYYFHCPREVDDELARYLDEEAESRAKSQITEGYTQGELNYEGNDPADETRQKEINCRGWWQIER